MSDGKAPFDVLFAAESLLRVRTGIGNYAHNLWTGLRAAPEIRRVRTFAGLRETTPAQIAAAAAAPPPPAAAETAPSALRRFARDFPPARWAHGAVYRARLAAVAAKSRFAGVPVCYHEPNMIARPFDGVCVVTVHDLTWRRHPETMSDERRRWIERGLPRSLAQATRIITDTAYVKQEVVEALGVDPRRIDVIPLGVDPVFHPRPREALASALAARDLTPGGYVLAVGTVEPRKNLRRLLQAYAMSPAALTARFPLVVAGASGWVNDDDMGALRRLEQAGLVRYLGFAAADELPLLYAGARAFVFPSLYEGFGLPLLEAMASGVPVICSSAPSLRETAGEAACFADPGDEADIAAALRRVLEDDAFSAHLVESGARHVAGFSWAACVAGTIDVYRKALASA